MICSAAIQAVIDGTEKISRTSMDALRADLHRFAFLLGGSDGEYLFGKH